LHRTDTLAFQAIVVFSIRVQQRAVEAISVLAVDKGIFR
jgi:hypothetical protein